MNLLYCHLKKTRNK